MNPLLGSEVLKLRTTRTTAGLAAAMTALVVTAVVLHGYGLAAEQLSGADGQLNLLVGWGEVLGALFAGLLGALSFTTEIRHGTIRPTLLTTPRRRDIIISKAAAAALAGLAIGLIATGAAIITGRFTLAVRGLDVAVTTNDVIQLVAGGAVAAGLWAVIGVGVGALARNQVPTIVGILVWVLFVEGLLVDNAATIGRYAPGALGQSISGLHPDTLLAPALSIVLLVGFAAAAVTAGITATTRRDFS